IGEPDAEEHLQGALVTLDLLRIDDAQRQAFRQAVQFSLESLRTEAHARTTEAGTRPRRATAHFLHNPSPPPPPPPLRIPQPPSHAPAGNPQICSCRGYRSRDESKGWWFGEAARSGRCGRQGGTSVCDPATGLWARSPSGRDCASV